MDTDEAIVDALRQKLTTHVEKPKTHARGDSKIEAEYDEHGQVISLTLQLLGLTHIPQELLRLTTLQKVDLSFNDLEQV